MFFFLHCAQAIAAHPVPDHMRLYYKVVDFVSVQHFFPHDNYTWYMYITAQTCSLHSVTCRVWPCKTTRCMGTLYIPRRGSPGHFLFLVYIQYNTRKQVAEKCYTGLCYCINCSLHWCNVPGRRLYWDSFWFCGLGQTPGHNLTPLDSIAWLQPPETQNNTLLCPEPYLNAQVSGV